MKNGDLTRRRLNRFEDSEDEDLRRRIHLRRWASHELLPVVKTAKDRDDESRVTIVYTQTGVGRFGLPLTLRFW
jgi:hypothetical protein